MGYTVDKKTGKLILVHDVTVSSKAVNQPETQQQQSQRQQEQQTTATLPAIPAAEQFQTWVCEEVLPAIRKTGGYGVVVPAPSAPAKTEDQLILEAMQVLLSRTETLKAELAEAKPKADYYDALVDDRDLLTFTEAGKLFGMSARSLAAFLRDAKGTPHHWLFKGFDGANIPYQPIIDRGLMKVKHRTSSLNGMPCTQGYFTPKGVEALRRLLRG